MAVSADLVERIMGAPDSPTGKLVALRRVPGTGELETGVWYSNFTRVREEAERRGLPFFAMWTNGDLCGFCRRFTRNILEPSFLERMRTSGGLWWLGGSMDDDEEDRRGGRGFMWCVGPEKKVVYFPFFAVSYQPKDAKLIQFFGSGNDYDERKDAPEGTALIMQRLFSILSGQSVSSSRSPAPLVLQKTPSVDVPVADLRIRVNPAWDAAHVARFHSALQENAGHCVCQKDKTPDTLCLCRAFMEQRTPGFCHCGAYEKYRV